MPHDLSKAYEPGAIEPRWADYWVREKLFHVKTPASDSKQPVFTLILPPPNVTGRLHMGHMLNQTQMDIIIRWHRMRGFLTMASRNRPRRHRHPDDGGTPTGRRRHEPSRHRPGSLHRARVGLEAALWRRDPRPDEAAGRIGRLVARVLHHGRAHVARGARSLRPPLRRRTHLSRQVHRELVPALHHRRFRSRSRARGDTGQDLRDSLSMSSVRESKDEHIVVATTRPETMLGDTAVAVNSGDEPFTAICMAGRSYCR